MWRFVGLEFGISKVGTPPNMPNLLFYYIFLSSYGTHIIKEKKAFAFLQCRGTSFHKIIQTEKRMCLFHISNLAY